MINFKAEFWRQFYLYKRYLFNYISEFFLLILMFMAIFWGGSLVGGGVLGKSLNALVVGYVLWSLIENTISQMGSTVMNNAKSGILEQQYLMPISSRRLFLNKSIANIVVAFVQAILILIAVMAISDHWISFPVIMIVPFILALLTTVGLGYLIVSLVLRFKRIGSTLVIFQYIYLGILLVNFENCSNLTKCLSCLLPICPMVSWMRLAVNNRPYNLAFYLSESIFNTVLWLIIGLLVFNLADKYVKKNGTLSFY